MALLNGSSFFTNTFQNYSTFVFGSEMITSIVFLLLLLVVALLIRIPLPVSLSLTVPIALVMMAIGWLPVAAGSILVVVLMILSGLSIVAVAT